MAKTEMKGYLKTWKDDRGFGFIKPDDGSDDVFIHISALSGMARRPYRGDTLFFEIEQDAQGKTKAINARIDGVDYIAQEKPVSKKWLWLVAAALGLVSAAAAALYVMN